MEFKLFKNSEFIKLYNDDKIIEYEYQWHEDGTDFVFIELSSDNVLELIYLGEEKQEEDEIFRYNDKKLNIKEIIELIKQKC